jgi:ubiquitin-activating enzyme E1
MVVLTNATITKQVEINEFCRSNGIYFTAADVRGLFGYVAYSVQCSPADHVSSVFNDFGKDFACVDPTGEQPQNGMIVHIEEVSLQRYLSDLSLIIQSEEALVTCLDETRHGLEDGDFVTFTEVKGMEQLNGCEPRKVTVKGQLF